MFITATEIIIKKFGKLRIKIPQDITSGSAKKIEWICDCGREKLIRIHDVISNQTKTCGNCNQISAEEIVTEKFGKLRIKIPQNITYGSHKKIEWICDCGREKLINIHSVLSKNTTSCGQCNLISVTEITTKKFGKLQIKTPQNITRGSHKKIEWICDCGREKLIEMDSVLFGLTTSCGQCNQITAAEVSSKKFGKLRIKNSINVFPWSTKKVVWICDCGREKLIKISFVLQRKVISCGQCSKSVKDWYIQNRKQIRALKCPIKPENFILGGIIPLKIIKNVSDPFKAICPACKSIYYPTLDHIKLGRSLTCGCASYRISMPCIEISEYIRSLGFEVINEFKVNKLVYDIFVPAKNLLIEFQGSRWHAMKGSKERDLRKKQNAIQNGYRFMEILEKDWNTRRDEIENIMRRVLEKF
jgi:hypothetical protein